MFVLAQNNAKPTYDKFLHEERVCDDAVPCVSFTRVAVGVQRNNRRATVPAKRARILPQSVAQVSTTAALATTTECAEVAYDHLRYVNDQRGLLARDWVLMGIRHISPDERLQWYAGAAIVLLQCDGRDGLAHFVSQARVMRLVSHARTDIRRRLETQAAAQNIAHVETNVQQRFTSIFTNRTTENSAFMHSGAQVTCICVSYFTEVGGTRQRFVLARHRHNNRVSLTQVSTRASNITSRLTLASIDMLQQLERARVAHVHHHQE